MEVILVRAGVDWLSQTVSNDITGAQSYLARLYDIIQAIVGEGEKLQAGRLLGFEGWRAGGTFAGQDAARIFLQLSGARAETHWRTAYHPSGHQSRVDYQVTCKLDDTYPDIARDNYKSACDAADKVPASRRRKITMYVGSDGGDTLYVGSPSAAQRGRLYNKAIQSGQEEDLDCWRWEVSFRDSLAQIASEALVRPGADRLRTIADTVWEWYTRRGVECPWGRSRDTIILPNERAVPTDLERKLRWLREQVRPTLAYLCQVGFRDTIFAIVPELEGPRGAIGLLDAEDEEWSHS